MKNKRVSLTSLTVQTAPLRMLESLKLESRMEGRFSELRKKIVTSIENCKKSQFLIINLTKEIQNNSKERQAIQLGMGKEIKKFGWKMRFAKDQKVFYLFHENGSVKK